MHGPASVVAAKNDIACALSAGLQRSANDPPTMENTPAPLNPDITRKHRNIAGF
jgi:hypothetical protein